MSLVNDLPPCPTQKIIRHQEAPAWIEGYAFLAAAKEEHARIEEQSLEAKKKGFQEGVELGREAGEKAAAQQLERVNQEIDEYLANLQPEIIELGIGIVRRLLGRVDNSALLADLTRQALSEKRDTLNDWRLRVAASQASAVRDALSQFPEVVERVKVESDDRLNEGRCLLVNAVSVVELSLEAQLERIRIAMSEGDT